MAVVKQGRRVFRGWVRRDCHDAIRSPLAPNNVEQRSHFRALNLTNNGAAGMGGMLAYLDIVAGCLGDINGSGFVDFNDLQILRDNFFTSCSGCPADLNGSGFIDFSDLQILRDNFFACNPIP